MGRYGETVRFYLVDVKDITPPSSPSRSQFQESELEQLANLILTTGCLLKPLILRQKGPMSYELIEGHFEYWAAVRAKEKEPIWAEMVGAFVVKPEIEASAIKQRMPQEVKEVAKQPNSSVSLEDMRITELLEMQMKICQILQKKI